MLHGLAVAFLVAHGLIHLAIWAPPPAEGAAFDVHRSPLRRDVRVASVALAVLAGVGFVVAGIGFLTGQAWWADVAVGSSGVSVLLMLLTFSMWWLAGLAIDVVIAVIARTTTSP